MESKLTSELKPNTFTVNDQVYELPKLTIRWVRRIEEKFGGIIPLTKNIVSGNITLVTDLANFLLSGTPLPEDNNITMLEISDMVTAVINFLNGE